MLGATTTKPYCCYYYYYYYYYHYYHYYYHYYYYWSCACSWFCICSCSCSSLFLCLPCVESGEEGTSSTTRRTAPRPETRTASARLCGVAGVGSRGDGMLTRRSVSGRRCATHARDRSASFIRLGLDSVGRFSSALLASSGICPVYQWRTLVW